MIQEGDGDTSVDSLMEDTPANYNIPNQRFDDNYDVEPIPEEGHRSRSKPKPRVAQKLTNDSVAEDMRQVKRKKKKSKKTKP